LSTRADETDKHVSEVEGRTARLTTRADETDKHVSEVEGKLDRFEADSQRHRNAIQLLPSSAPDCSLIGTGTRSNCMLIACPTPSI
jgi:hypothetical protein